MFISLNVIQKIEARYIGRRVQRSPTVKSGLTSVEAPIPGAMSQVGTVVGILFNTTASSPGAPRSEFGLLLGLPGGISPFSLIVERDGGACEVWSTWTLTPDRQSPSSASLLDDVLEDTISVDAFASFVGIDKVSAEKLIEAEVERRKLSAQD